MTEIARLFEARIDIKLTLSSGASGLLQRQAAEGAPFDIFISADMRRVEELGEQDVIDSSTIVNYADGLLILWQPNSEGPRLSSVADLGRPEFARLRLAIANPEHAPYGIASRQTLEALDLWAPLGPNIVYAENVWQAYQYAKTGNVDAAFLPLSLVQMDWDGVMAVDESLYQPIRQGLGILTRSQERAASEAFVEFLRGPEGAAILKRYGFRIPGESPAASNPDATQPDDVP